MDETTGVSFPLEELIRKAPDSAREAFVERSAAFEAGDLVRTMREKAHLTQKQLAKRISTSQSHLSEVERGNGLQGSTFSMLRKVSYACAIDLQIDLSPSVTLSRLNDITAEQRNALAEGLGVAQDHLGQALIAARDKALTILSATFLEQILEGRAEMAYNYARWLSGTRSF